MQLTKWVHEPLWISKVKVIHWPLPKVTQIQHLQAFFPEKPLGWLKPNFMWILHGMGEWKFVQMVQVTWPRWSPCPFMAKRWKFFFSVTNGPMTLKDDMQHRLLEYSQVCSNDDSGITLTYFMPRSDFVPYAFLWEEGKTIDFSETIVVSDIKVGRCSQLNEYMKLMSTKGQGHSLTVVHIFQIQYF